jgi:hypothetical protein
MRFWIGLFLGLVIGAAGTIAYYEVDTGVDEEQVSEPVTQGGVNKDTAASAVAGASPSRSRPRASRVTALAGR